jgi:predicted transglutaminase-like cysteine proteinase
MNILISNNDVNKVIQNGTILEGITAATSLGLTKYGVSSISVSNVVVNNELGEGYALTLNQNSTDTRYLVFDTSTNNVLSWVDANYPSATIVNFSKTTWSLYTI